VLAVPDAEASDFAKEASRESHPVAGSGHARRDQNFVDTISEWPASDTRQELESRRGETGGE
jgi:hypothetical protein